MQVSVVRQYRKFARYSVTCCCFTLRIVMIMYVLYQVGHWICLIHSLVQLWNRNVLQSHTYLRLQSHIYHRFVLLAVMASVGWLNTWEERSDIDSITLSCLYLLSYWIVIKTIHGQLIKVLWVLQLIHVCSQTAETEIIVIRWWGECEVHVCVCVVSTYACVFICCACVFIHVYT